MKRATLVLIPALLAAPARAGDNKATAISGLDITEPLVCFKAHSPPSKDVPAPRLVSTYPAKGEVVSPGLLVLRLSFDLPMTCSASLGTEFLSSDPCASGDRELWNLSYDRRNFRVLCLVKPCKRYSLWINRHAPEDFKAVSGHKPDAYELVFNVSEGPPVTTVEEAVARDLAYVPPAKP